MGHDPLVVPPGQPPGRLEHGRPRHPLAAQVVHQPVVELLHRYVELEDDQCLVVAGVGDDRGALGAAVGVVGADAGHVLDGIGLHVPGLCFVHAVRPLELADDLAVRTLNDQELVPVVGVVELGVLAGALPVDGVEVVAGGAEVGGGVGVGLLLAEERGVEGDVVVDELADEGEPGREDGVRVLVGGVVCVFLAEELVGLAAGCSSMVTPRRSSSVSDAGCGGWLLNMNPKRPSVVGLLVTRSMPRSSAPWGGMGASSAAAAGAIHGPLTAVPSEAVAAVPSETAAVVFRKRRRSNARALFSPITNPPVDSLYLRDLLALYPSGLARNA